MGSAFSEGTSVCDPGQRAGRDATVTLDVTSARLRRVTGLADALILLHMSPGQHMADIRKNWVYMRVWSWLADATVCLTLFITVSGIYLWYVLKSERKVGVLLADAASFFGMVYALSDVWRRR